MRDSLLFELVYIAFLLLVMFFSLSNIGSIFQDLVLIGFAVVLFGIWETIIELKSDDYL